MSKRMYRRPSAQESDDPVFPIHEDFPVCYRLEPEKRLVPRFDSCCIAEFTVAKPGKMGFRVVDNCCEDHMM